MTEQNLPAIANREPSSIFSGAPTLANCLGLGLVSRVSLAFDGANPDNADHHDCLLTDDKEGLYGLQYRKIVNLGGAGPQIEEEWQCTFTAAAAIVDLTVKADATASKYGLDRHWSKWEKIKREQLEAGGLRMVLSLMQRHVDRLLEGGFCKQQQRRLGF